jgi:hypothetical protein
MNKNSSYPFITRAQVAERVASDNDFCLMCLVILHDKQTRFEQATRSTKDRNRQGFMSSHAVAGSRLAEKVASGTALEPDEMAKARDIASHYSRQISVHLREEQKASSPELAEVARLYGV